MTPPPPRPQFITHFAYNPYYNLYYNRVINSDIISDINSDINSYSWLIITSFTSTNRGQHWLLSKFILWDISRHLFGQICRTLLHNRVHWVPHHGTSGYHGNPHSSTPFDNFASVKVRHLADLKST